MSSHCPRILVALVLIIVVAGVAAAVPVVDNPAEPPTRETITLREAWRAGGEDDLDVLLGQIGAAVSGPDGELYALDSQLSQVLVFGDDGEHRQTLGREGDGPGEFRQPVGLFLPGDGTLAVQQAFPGRITYLGLDDGMPRGSWELGKNDPNSGGFGFVAAARQRGGSFVISAATTNFDPEARQIRSTNYLAIVTADGSEVARLAEVSAERSMVRFTIDELEQHNPGDRGLWDIAPDGRIYLAPRYDAYEIALHGPDGAHVGTIARAYEARLRTEAEKDEVRNSMQININGQEPEIDWNLQDRHCAIDRLQVRDDGSLWVRNSHGQDQWDDAGSVVYDVFDADGRLQREVTVVTPDGGAGDRLIMLDDGRFLLVKGMDSLSISITAGNDDDVHVSDEELGDVLIELVCLKVDH